MKRKSGEIQVFSMSFLDVISCALGGTLLLLLLVQQTSSEEAEAHKQEKQQMQKKIDNTQSELTDAISQIEDLEQKKQSDAARLAALKDANRKLTQAQATLTGLGGKLENVVFIFDTSGSMQDNNFPYYLSRFDAWVKTYPFKQFNIIRFSSDVHVWKPSSLVSATDSNRAAASNHINSFSPSGSTNTMGALRSAYDLPNVDTVVIFTDGDPQTGGTKDDIENFLKSNRNSIVLNTVAIGHNVDRNWLKNLSKMTGGSFQGI